MAKVNDVPPPKKWVLEYVKDSKKTLLELLTKTIGKQLEYARKRKLRKEETL